MPGLVPGIHAVPIPCASKMSRNPSAWMAGTSPAMTVGMLRSTGAQFDFVEPGTGDLSLCGVARAPHGEAERNGVDPQAWLNAVLGKIAEHRISKLDESRPWRCVAQA